MPEFAHEILTDASSKVESAGEEISEQLHGSLQLKADIAAYEVDAVEDASQGMLDLASSLSRLSGYYSRLTPEERLGFIISSVRNE